MKEPSERYGIEPFRAFGKRSPLRGHKSVAPATQEVPRNRSAAGADQRTHAAIGQSNRAPEFSGRVRRRRRPHLDDGRDHVPPAAFVLTMFKTQSETDDDSILQVPLLQRLLRL